MSASSSGGSNPNQLISSEQVLEKLFRAGYDRWIADAKKRLGAEAAYAAPRVVSKVFHLAWTDRARFNSQDELDAFLGANVQHQSARELSKKAAAGRMDAIAGEHKHHEHKEMTVDDAWSALKGTLQAGSNEAYRERASSARHEAAGHMADLGKDKFNWKPIAIIIGVALVVAIGFFRYVDKAGADRAVLRALTAGDARNYESSFGQQMKITLDDSTVVLLGPESKLTVPKMFGVDIRAVKIEGTANFTMNQQKATPLEVRAGNAIITSPKADFTVRKFKEDNSVIVAARKGPVDVRAFEDQVVKNLTDGGGWVVPDSGAQRVPTSEEISETGTWVDGKASILGHDLRAALPLLKRWYGLDIHVEDQALLDRPVFINADITSKNAAIKAVEQSGNLKFTYIADNMAFVDAKAKAPATKSTKKK